MVALPRRSPRSPSRSLPPLAVLPLAVPLALAALVDPAAAQQGYGQTMGSSPMEQQIYNYEPTSGSQTGSGSAGLNPANPLDLINKIRKGNALNDATPPGDAVDQALKELEAQSRPASAAKPASPLVASPPPGGGAGAAP